MSRTRRSAQRLRRRAGTQKPRGSL